MDDNASETTPPPPPRPPAREMRAAPNLLLRTLIVLAVLLVLIATSVPFIVVAMGSRARGGMIRFASPNNTIARTAMANVARPYTLPKDPSITPEQAGAAMVALMTPERDSAFSFRAVQKRDSIPWQNEEITPGMFNSAAPGEDKRLPRTDRILIAAKGKLSTDELDFLERVAHAGLWADYETVGRANAVDALGARFVLPFPDSVNAFDLPIPRFASSKGLAYAGVSRAAYYLAKNQRDSAEHALYAVNSFGFAMMDNATSLIEHLIGAVVVGIGRTALIQLDSITGNPRGPRLRALTDSTKKVAEAMVDRRGWRAGRLADAVAIAEDTTVPRAVRYDGLMNLSLVPCYSAANLLFGAPAEMDSAFALQKRKLARFPSEIALIDLMEHTTDRPIRSVPTERQGLLLSTAALSAGLLRAPRLLTCTQFVTLSR